MIFTKSQIDEILKTIDAHTRYLLGLNLGYKVLSNSDVKLLKTHGINIEELQLDWPPYLQAYMFGRLAAILSDYQLNQVTYQDFSNYLKKQQFIPLSPREKEEYAVAEQKTYNHIVSLGEKMKNETRNIIYNEDLTTRLDQEKVLREELKRGVVDRKQIKSIISSVAKRMGTWSVDWGRIVDTEMQDIFNRGVANSIKERFGSDQKVYKDTYSGACRYCIKLHFTSGIGSEPILFTLDQLYANGTNIGKKKDDWLATVGPEHPFCRCHIRYVLSDQVWDRNNKSFKTVKKKGAVKRETNVFVNVNDKLFVI